MGARGVAMSVSEQNANRLIAAKGTDALIELVSEVYNSSEVFDFDCAWDAIGRCLNQTDYHEDINEDAYPLNLAVLGGEILESEEDSDFRAIRYVSPSQVREVAVAIKRVSKESFCQQFLRIGDPYFQFDLTLETAAEIWMFMPGFIQFYQRAATAGNAVIVECAF
jgi:hypothetical protein